MRIPDPSPTSPLADTLPAELLARFNGQLSGQRIDAWAEFDLDASNQYARQFVVLAEDRLIFAPDGAEPTILPLAQIQEARIVEGLGFDRLSIIVADKLAAELRYTRRQRSAMTRLNRHLQRRLPRREGAAEPPPDWLQTAERQQLQREICPKCGQSIPGYAEGVCPQCMAKRQILWRLLDSTKPYKLRVYVTLFLTITVAALATLPAIITRYMIDTAVVPKSAVILSNAERYNRLFMLSLAMLATIAFSEFLQGLRMRSLAIIATNVTADLRHKVYSHLHELSLRYFAKRRTGSLITRVTNDTDRLWDFIVFGSIDLIRDVALIAFIAAVMFYTNWRLAAVTLLPLPILGILTYRRGMKMQKLWGRLWTYWSRMTAVVGDSLPGIRVVKAFASEKREIRRFDIRSEECRDMEQNVHRVWTSLQPVVSGMMRAGALLVWIVGGYQVIRYGGQGNYTIGVLMLFTTYVWQFYQPIMELANSNRVVTRAASSAQRVFEVLDTPPEILSEPGSLQPENFRGQVEFRNVSFSYEGAQPALREISVDVQPGEMIGLCGPSGAGKSTFVNLICRFYDATDGQILIDGHDIRDYDVHWLRRQIGLVLQEPYLFHGSIADNIRYGAPDATETQVITAARAANAHDFIVGFPDGYDTTVGERGQSLSGGERQRISIARAILHNPKILILDEATSSVDTETEKQIQQALDRLVEGRTTFAIAHRLSTLLTANRLIVLDKGKIVEQGGHADLLAKPEGVYAKLHKTQLEMNSLVALR